MMSKLNDFFKYMYNNFDYNSKLLLIVAFSICLLSSLFFSITPILLAKIIDSLIENIHIQNWLTLSLFCSCYIIIISLLRLFPVLSHFTKMLLNINTSLILSQSYFKYIYKKSPTFFEKNNAGSISLHSTQINNEIYILINSFIDGFLGPVLKITFVLSIIFATTDWVVFMLFILYIFSFMINTSKFTKKLVAIKQDVMNSGRESYKILSDSTENLSAIKNSNSFNFLFTRYVRFKQSEKNINIKFGKIVTGMEIINSVLSILFFGGCFIYILYGVIHNNYSIGYLVMMATYITLLSAPIEGLGRSYSQVKQSLNFLDNFISEFNKDFLNKENELEQISKQSLTISIKNLSFKYPSSNTSALSNIDLDFSTGQFLTFTGHSGSGKTTLAKLLTLQYEEFEGSLTINQKNIKEYSSEYIKNKIYLVTQDEFIFLDTLRFNLLIANPDATDGELLNALSMANFSYPNIEGIELLDLVLGNNGMTISGGQKQRISLARLFLQQPELIIIDESTSSLDLVNEKIVFENIIKQFPEAIKISISHRPTTFFYTDLIYVFNSGKIIDYGTIHELLKRNEYIKEIMNNSTKVEQ